MTKDNVVNDYPDGHPAHALMDWSVKCYGYGGIFTGANSPYGAGASKAEIEFAVKQYVESVEVQRLVETESFWVDDSDRQWIGEYLRVQKKFPEGEFKDFFKEGQDPQDTLLSVIMKEEDITVH